jgi:MacB-like periplasmic core domain
MHWLWRDLRFGWRSLRKDGSSTLLAVFALALGIGTVTTIYSVIQNVLLDPFPYRDAGHIYGVEIHNTDRENDWRSGFQIPEILDFEANNHVFDSMIGAGHEDVLYSHGEGTEFLDGCDVTPNTFDFLGMQPMLGRGLKPEDAQPGSPPVFVMSYKLWVKLFDRDAKIVGRTFSLNQTARTLVGIMPPRFTFWGADLWIPYRLDAADPNVKTRYFSLFGHPMPAITREQAVANLDVIARRAGGDAGGGRGGTFSRDAADPAGRGRHAPADRVQQRCQPIAGARHGSRKGDRHSRLAGRRTLADCASTARRKPDAFFGCGGVRLRVRVGGIETPGVRDPAQHVSG